MTINGRIRLFMFLAVLTALIWLGLAPVVFASDRDDDRLGPFSSESQADAAANANALAEAGATAAAEAIGGDVLVEGSNYSSRAYGASHSLGDVDINQCIVTKQTGTFIVSWQGYDYNLWCMGEVFDAKGLYKMGAEMRCDIKPIASKFEFREDCLAANTVDQEIVVSPELEALYSQAAKFEEHEEAEEAHDAELERVQMEQTIILDRMAEYDTLIEQRSAQAPPRPTGLTEAQKQALKEVINQ
jgi:hypothetical protein